MASKPNPHSRFIPREEIEGVAAWHFSAMDGSDEHLHASATDKTEGVTSEALQEARQQAYAEGFERGHEAGGQEVRESLEATVRKTAEETAVRMAQLLHNTKDHLHKSEEKISRHILELACDLARQVLRQALVSDPQHLKPVIAEALSQLVEDGLPAGFQALGYPSDVPRPTVAMLNFQPAQTTGAPEDGNRLYGTVSILVSAVLYALNIVLLRLRSKEEDSLTLVTFMNVFPALFLLPFMLFFSRWTPEAHSWGAMIGVAFLGIGIWWLMTLAYAKARAQTLAPFEYTGLIWSALLGYTFFQEIPGWRVWAGAGIIIAACLVVAFETHFIARREAKLPASDILT